MRPDRPQNTSVYAIGLDNPTGNALSSLFDLRLHIFVQKWPRASLRRPAPPGRTLRSRFRGEASAIIPLLIAESLPLTGRERSRKVGKPRGGRLESGRIAKKRKEGKL